MQLLCDRAGFLPTLAVRPACVEDHDNLVPIFQAQVYTLAMIYTYLLCYYKVYNTLCSRSL
jgi:Domain of unknown function (DUF4821)